MTKLCQCEPDTYPATQDDIEYKNRDEWLKDHLDAGLFQHHYDYDQAGVSGEYYWCHNCGHETFDHTDWKEFEFIKKAMRNPFTEEGYYHDEMELWMGDCPRKILLTPEAAEWAWDGVPLEKMKQGVDYQYGNDSD
jgi:hypothetical protein